MKVKDLIDILEGLDENEEVYFLPTNSYYPEDFSDDVRRNMNINSFWGGGHKATILFSDGQVGGLGGDDEEEEEDD